MNIKKFKSNKRKVESLLKNPGNKLQSNLNSEMNSIKSGIVNALGMNNEVAKHLVKLVNKMKVTNNKGKTTVKTALGEVTIDCTDFLNDLAIYQEMLAQALENAIVEICLKVERDAKMMCPVDDGILRASITSEVENHWDRVDGYIGSGIEYAAYVHQGTGVYASNGSGRQTPWVYKAKDGKFIKTIGQKPNPFLKNAIDKNLAEINSIIEKNLRNY